MTKKGIIYETLGSTAGMQIVESHVPGEVRLSGVFGVCGIKNGNNRIYEKSNYGKMVGLMQERMKSESILGELEHPNTMNITLENVSHMIEDIQMNEDGTVTGTIRLLDTPKGQIAKAIIEGGAPLYISSRGAGSIDESGHVTLTMLQTYDLVGTPGFAQAKLTLKNDQKFECLNESLENPVWMIVESEEDPKPKEGDLKEDPKPKDGENNKDGNASNEDITMKDIKNSVDELAKKVGQLEAELHIAKEAKETAEEALREAQEKVINYDGVQQWIEEEYIPAFRASIMESINDSTKNNVMTIMKESILPGVQQWVVEEFAPQVQNWTIDEFAPQIQNWISEEYSEGLQKWISEEYSEGLQDWIVNHFAPEHAKQIEESVNKNVSAFLESQKDDRYSNIDTMLEKLADVAAGHGDAQQILESQQKDKYSGIAIVEGMPSNYRPLWEALTDEKKDAIIRESRMYDMTRPGAVDKFWASRKMTADTVLESKQTKPSQPTIQEAKGNAIVAQMKRIGGQF